MRQCVITYASLNAREQCSAREENLGDASSEVLAVQFETDYSAKRNMTLIRRLIERTAQGRQQLIGWLQEERLLAKKKRCPACNNKMKLKRTNTTKDGYRW